MLDRKRLIEDLYDYAYDAECEDCDDSVHRRALDYIALLEARLATIKGAWRFGVCDENGTVRIPLPYADTITEAVDSGAFILTSERCLPGETSGRGYTAFASTGDYCGPVRVIVVREED